MIERLGFREAFARAFIAGQRIALLGGTLRRYSGDLATLGKGEMFVPA